MLLLQEVEVQPDSNSLIPKDSLDSLKPALQSGLELGSLADVSLEREGMFAQVRGIWGIHG